MTPCDWTTARCAAVWEEYKYRHDLCWRLIVQITAVAVTLSIVPYLAPIETTLRLGVWLLLVPLLACFATFVGLLWMQLELRHFAAVDSEYIECRSSRGQQGDSNEYGSVPFVINVYLIGILLLSLLNLFVIADIWLPAGGAQQSAVFHARFLQRFAGGIAACLVLRGAIRAFAERRSSPDIRWKTVLIFATGLVIWGALSAGFLLAARELQAPSPGVLACNWFVVTSLCALFGAGLLLLLESAIRGAWDNYQAFSIVRAWLARRG